MEVEFEGRVPFLWGEQVFRRRTWGPITYFVGPNGTGKTKLAEEARRRFQESGLRTRYLSAERLAGLEQASYSYFSGGSPLERGLDTGQFANYRRYGAQYGLLADSWIVLKEKPDVRMRVEALLFQIFKRQMRLVEQGGFLMPLLQREGVTGEYNLKQAEAHGLKELIGLLAFVYDDEFQVMIIDEPELHLHPQFQQFLLWEIRKSAGNPQDGSGRAFVLLTHSPYILDIRSVSDLKDVVVFQPGRVPSSVTELTEDDSYRLGRMIPRLNTHNKQFFFASRPVFLEGYTDQQLIVLIQEKRGRMTGAAGVAFVDLGGKDDIEAFYRLAQRYGMNPCAIVDYDALFEGRLRQLVGADSKVQEYLAQEGLGRDLVRTISNLYPVLDRIAAAVQAATSLPADLRTLRSALERASEVERRRRIIFLATRIVNASLSNTFPSLRQEILQIRGLTGKIVTALEGASVFLLADGELEHYLPSLQGSPYEIADTEKNRP